jgi:hypothetical protein
MVDFTAPLLSQLRQHRLPGLDLGEEFIYPDYGGRSILNLPGSVCRWLGAQPFGAPEGGTPPLAPELVAPLGERTFKRVILVLMDALALHRLQRWMADGTAPLWGELAQAGESVFAPLTSVVPCTTSAALTSLWTGRSPAEHGVAGYELWLKEYGVVANMILHGPISFKGSAGSLAQAGFSPESFLPLPTLGTHLAANGAQAYAFQNHSILHSGLSEMFFKDVRRSGFYTAADLWVNVRRLVESRPQERLYLWVYWSELDTFGHRYGPDDERTAAEFAAFGQALERLFLEKLKPELRGDTLLILAADHGQVATTPDPYYQLRSHPNLARRLHLLPTGEHRLAYLYIRPGQMEAVRETLERTWPGGFKTLDPAFAVETGLFGPGTPHPRLLDRLGDLIALARGSAYLWWPDKDDHLLGRHGGLHPDEMLVPFLAAVI